MQVLVEDIENVATLSATLHDGKGEAFRSLISYIDPFIVAEDQDLTRETVNRVMIRRGKETIYDDNGERIFPERDVQTSTVSMSPAEEQLYERVTEYVREVYNRSDQLNEPAVGFAPAVLEGVRNCHVGRTERELRQGLRNVLAADASTDGRNRVTDYDETAMGERIRAIYEECLGDSRTPVPSV